MMMPLPIIKAVIIHLTVIQTDEDGVVSNAFFSRDADGNERFEETSSDGNAVNFIERREFKS